MLNDLKIGQAARPGDFARDMLMFETDTASYLAAQTGLAFSENPLHSVLTGQAQIGNPNRDLGLSAAEWNAMVDRRLDILGLPDTPENRETAGGQIYADRYRNPLSGDYLGITRDQWEASEWWRPGIPYRAGMTTEAARDLAGLYDDRQRYEWIIEHHDTDILTGALGVGAALVGAAADPSNYIPVLGPASRAYAVGRLGTVGGHAAVSAAEAAISTALFEPLVAANLAQIGVEMDFGDAVLDVALSTAVGAVFGTAGGFLARRSERQAQRRLADLMRSTQATSESLTRVAQAQMQIEAGRVVDVPPMSAAARRDVLRTAQQAEAISAIRSGVRDYDPFGRYGGAQGIGLAERVEIPVTDAQGAARVYPTRQEAVRVARALNDEFDAGAYVARGGDGFVVREPIDARVERNADGSAKVYRNPDLLRATLRAYNSGAEQPPWHTRSPGYGRFHGIEVEGGHIIVQGLSDAQALAMRVNPNRWRIGADLAPDERPGYVANVAQAAEPQRGSAARPSSGEDVAAPISRDAYDDAGLSVTHPPIDPARYEEWGVTPDGQFAELADFEALREAGRLTDDETAQFARATEIVQQYQRAAEAYDAAAVCMLRAA